MHRPFSGSSPLPRQERPGTGPTDTTAGATTGIEGTWTVDTETGDFDFETASGTFAGFRVEEELSTVGSTTAVGRTGEVTGSFTIEGTTVTDAEFEIDLTTLTTNESRRDGRVQVALETSEDEFTLELQFLLTAT